jgi:hypothetical protein
VKDLLKEAVMVLEAFAAIGLAGNIVQFVDFSCKLFSESREIYSSASGVTNEATDLLTITKNLEEYCVSLSTNALGPRTPSNSFPKPLLPKLEHELALRKLVEESRDAAQELLKIIEKVRAKNPNSKWDSFQACLKGIMKREKIERLAERMDSFRLQLIIQLEAMREYGPYSQRFAERLADFDIVSRGR